MRVLNARFALGLGLFTVVFAIADTAQGGPIRNWRARRAGVAYSAPVAYAPVGYAGGYGQAMYGAADPCCPQTGLVYGGAYGGAAMMPSPYGIQPAGGIPSYYTPGGATPLPMPGGTIPAPLPSTLPTSPDASVKAVEIGDSAFEPKTITIEPGTTVKWTNKGQKPHAVTSDKGDWGSGDLATGQTFTATFTKAGEFTYHCKLHPDMKGTITVK